MDRNGQEFIRQSRYYLAGEYLPKIRAGLAGMTTEDLWWRPNRESNSVANLVLHLAGNVRQWVVAGVGQEPDVRERSAEFAAAGGLSGDELVSCLEAALEEVDRVLANLDPTVLSEPRTIQGLETTGLGALYHAVEHFSMHTGQILYIIKLRTGADLRFYDVDAAGDVKTNW